MIESTSSKRNVAVIGGGTGLTTAWALDKQQQFNVIVFEQNNDFGGHIQSIKANEVILEGGAEFIGNPDLYPNVHRLFQYLKVPLQEFELNIDFHNINKDHHIVLPPVFHTDEHDDISILGCLSFFNVFRKNKPQKDAHISFHTLYHDFCNLLSMNEIINKAKKRLLNPDELITLEDFVNSYINETSGLKSHRTDFANKFLYPLIAAAWGVSVDTIKTFGAHYGMNYLTSGPTWYDATEGLSSYIHKLMAKCHNTQFVNNTPIKKIIPIVDNNGQTRYHLLKSDDTYCSDTEGPVIFDDIVITTPAYITKELISELRSNALNDLQKKLAKVQYYDTTVVFHRDSTYRTPNNTVVHTRVDGENAANTMCKEWKFKPAEIPIMKTWVLPGQPMPENIVKVVQYRHPVMNRDYYEAQQTMHQHQGLSGLWWGGIMAGYNDSHESGITAALTVATMLCQQEHCLEDNKRLAMFPDILDDVEECALGMAPVINAHA
ncbi:amine oxidase [Legionella norrlandica]|uniref:Amine oxidase n=1 Tax=Legionella norrlandica TaxID=1498499 RepID=A0A0A2SNN8_9GAMM|nr:FAD-dependent oxidoreductase [Legionella norrlandica]KGP62760.1 amine oxidase [Legionella norrlandica]